VRRRDALGLVLVVEFLLDLLQVLLLRRLVVRQL
jgi:hypothetical protein